eukprot:CAMPEP_0184368514 /NCGR_PEP_ID=MMETSP1089-20130417/161709_1 /TAXON_ID=38269 ORGANISM="Gloeochaete wittrockiana, Strain SAG46.84" /NCGR_SAMPLE_ID=MMETSP1089 /ASSEMBLY_ACC=CAM_ASM_000445 /LENGTH=121 /DNA_ID=CAMNT_0026710813 /DNA_START=515 /DNA_END=882 /DNA_ORIENTATION=+
MSSYPSYVHRDVLKIQGEGTNGIRPRTSAHDLAKGYARGFSSTGAGTLGQSPRLQQALDDMYEHLVRRCVGLYAGLEQSTFDPPAKSDDDDKQEEDDDAGELPEGEEDDEKNDYDEYAINI